ncbi:MAG: peptidoglycan DD-metalloendopeptidase family protein [Oscillospiraceae bacterium]|nr:peptidoglycan DD-metalloendopeptidase family protein [Oscillospiraceae bacterium]
MKNKTVRIISAVIAATLVFSLLFAFVAEIVIYNRVDAAQTVSSLNSKLDSLASQKAKIQKELKAIKSKKQSTMTKKAALDQQIDVTEQEVDTINQLITALDVQVATVTAELNAAQEAEQKQTDDFLARVRIMEEEGTASMLGIILSADSFSDMLTRTELIGSIVEGDKKLMRELAETRAGIAEKKASLDSARAEQAAAKSNLVAKKNSLQSQYNEANALLKSLNTSAAEYEKAFNEAERAMDAARADLQKLLSKSGSSTYVGGEFRWPTKATRITSPYGTRKDPITKKSSMHTGIDIGASMGSEIYASNSGTVIVAGWSSKGYGNYVVVDHGGGKSTLYAHMSKIKTKKGAKVTKGDVIGLVGSTGYSTGPHLHFEILINGKHTNPMNYFKKQ